MKISLLTLYTSRLEDQVDFYLNTLGLKLERRTSEAAEFKIGYSTLRFEYRKNATPYHFAVNIPSHKAAEALTWLKKRVPILKDRDDEIVAFRSWNATAIYFYDPDKNIVEFIARKNLKADASGFFDQNQLIGISEIGMPVEDIKTAFDKINDLKKTDIYDGSFDHFCAVGDESGLFIVVNKNTKKWFPVDDPVFSSDFKLRGDINFDFVKGEIIPNQGYGFRT